MTGVMPAIGTPFSRDKLLETARSLPADLEVLSTLGEMLQDVNADLGAIAALLRRDLALAARIVRISNSPLFGGRVASVEEAVSRVGFGEILRLVGTATTGRFADRALEHYGITALQLRDNMLYTAFACEELARLSTGDSRVAYTAGLLRPIGFMVLDRAARGRIPPRETFEPKRWGNYRIWEGSFLGVGHAEVAGLILDEWHFPKSMGAALRLHYLAQPADMENSLALTLNLAGTLAGAAGHAFEGETDHWLLTPEKLQAAGLNQEQLATAAEAAGRSFDRAVALLS
jgi:HD-like signal output (HDOD) protein